MATKNISITEEAYDRLSNLKKKNESFSEIIIKVTGKANLRDFFGIISKKKADEVSNNIKKSRVENRKLSEIRYKKLIRGLK